MECTELSEITPFALQSGNLVMSSRAIERHGFVYKWQGYERHVE